MRRALLISLRSDIDAAYLRYADGYDIFRDSAARRCFWRTARDIAAAIR